VVSGSGEAGARLTLPSVHTRCAIDGLQIPADCPVAHKMLCFVSGAEIAARGDTPARLGDRATLF
jgi:hypothetical protein